MTYLDLDIPLAIRLYILIERNWQNWGFPLDSPIRDALADKTIEMKYTIDEMASSLLNNLHDRNHSQSIR